MKGDVLLINENHRKAARQIMDILSDAIAGTEGKYVITVAGESGAGKSEIAASLAEELTKNGFPAYVFQQDDYFVLPPRSNAEKRREDISWVGPQEVRLDLLDENLSEAVKGTETIVKPLVDFNADSIGEEKVSLSGTKVLIAEGTYTTLLDNANSRIFIDRNIHDTRESRKTRAREAQDDFLEEILSIEHKIISQHKDLADLIVTRSFDIEIQS